MPVMALLLVAGTLLFAGAVWRRRDEAGPADVTLAQQWPRLVAMTTLLLLLISVVANKVFSPQYLLWVLPLVPLIDFHPQNRRLFFGATLVMCYLTMRIFPDCFVGDIVYVISGEGAEAVFGGPTAYGAFLLLARNGICVGLTVAVAVAGFRDWRWGFGRGADGNALSSRDRALASARSGSRLNIR